jgi:hypothetical protein
MLKFLHNDILVDMIRNLVDAYFSCSEKAWILPLNSNSIKFLLDIADLENYTLDEELERYIDQALEILKNMDDYIPCLILDNDLPKIRNSPKNLPELRSTEIVAAMFEARKLGITTWDSSVEHALQVEHLSNEALDFLKSGYMETTIIDSRKSEINSLKFLIDYMTPCLVIIPGGSELEKISEFSAFLKDCGMANEEISTMFRMSSEIGSDFNKFIKNNGLNNPITEKTKVVFVNVKFPKSVMKSKIRFNCTINLGTHPVHHTIKDYLKNNENLVLFVDRSKVKRMRKGELVW